MSTCTTTVLSVGMCPYSQTIGRESIKGKPPARWNGFQYTCTRTRICACIVSGPSTVTYVVLVAVISLCFWSSVHILWCSSS